MTVSHDFQLIDSCENLDEWQANNLELSINRETYLEGSGAINIYRTETSDTWASAFLNLPQEQPGVGHIYLLYIYVTREALNHISHFAIYLYNPSGTWNAFGRLETLRPGWNPIVMMVLDQRLQTINKLELRFYIRGGLPEGSFVIDRLMLGTGYQVLYSTEQNPDTLMDLVELDKRDNLMLVDAIGSYGYIVRTRIKIGNGTDTGTLKISDTVVLFDGVQLSETGLGAGFLEVYKGSVLDVENSILVVAARSSYPQSAMAIKADRDTDVRLKRSYLIDLKPVVTGYTTRYNFATNKLSIEDLFFNVILWLYTVRGVSFGGFIGLLPYASIVFDDYSINGYDFPSTPYVFRNAEIVPRQSKNVRFFDAVFAEGRMRTDGSIGVLIDPVNITKDNLVVGGKNSQAIAMYNVDIYVVDRFDNPLVNVIINIYDKYGTKVAQATTDYSGHAMFTLKVYEKKTDENGNIVVDEDYNPFTVEVIASGGVIAKTKMVVRNRQTIYVTPDNVYVMVTYPERSMVTIGEPVHIIAEVKKIDGTPVSGLDVYADVEKPDHSIATIILYEDPNNPGKYVGEYAMTDQAGEYSYRAYATLENAMIEAYNKFYVGVIEQGFNEIKQKLRTIEALVSLGTLNTM